MSTRNQSPPSTTGKGLKPRISTEILALPALAISPDPSAQRGWKQGPNKGGKETSFRPSLPPIQTSLQGLNKDEFIPQAPPTLLKPQRKVLFQNLPSKHLPARLSAASKTGIANRSGNASSRASNLRQGMEKLNSESAFSNRKSSQASSKTGNESTKESRSGAGSREATGSREAAFTKSPFPTASDTLLACSSASTKSSPPGSVGKGPRKKLSSREPAPAHESRTSVPYDATRRDMPLPSPPAVEKNVREPLEDAEGYLLSVQDLYAQGMDQDGYTLTTSDC
jgi:hypothetical protein